jgi:hypothetical protein
VYGGPIGVVVCFVGAIAVGPACGAMGIPRDAETEAALSSAQRGCCCSATCAMNTVVLLCLQALLDGRGVLLVKGSLIQGHLQHDR